MQPSPSDPMHSGPQKQTSEHCSNWREHCASLPKERRNAHHQLRKENGYGGTEARTNLKKETPSLQMLNPPHARIACIFKYPINLVYLKRIISVFNESHYLCKKTNLA